MVDRFERSPAVGLSRAGLAGLALLLAACSSGEPSGGGGGGGGGSGGGRGTPLPVKPFIDVHNLHGTARTETITASVPFSRGQVANVAGLAGLGVSGHATAWLPMQYWPDGSIRLAQAQWTIDALPNESRRFEVVRDVVAVSGPFEPNSWVRRATDLRFGARVLDTHDVAYEATVQGVGRVVQETPLVRVHHHRVYHRGSGGIGRDYLTSQFYVTEYHDMPFVLVDWILGNDYLGSDAPNGSTDPNLYPLGGIDVNRASFLVRGATETQPYLGELHAVQPAHDAGNGWTGFTVMSNDFIGDAQTRRYRFVVRIEDGGASAPDKQRWRDTYAGMLAAPMYALADLATWQTSAALGLQGGVVAGPSDARARAGRDYASWRGRAHFGTWGSFGDTKFTHTTGTPRNGPLSEDLAHAVQSGELRLLQVLEQKAWAQAQRDTHLYGLQVGAEQRILLWDMPPIYPGSRDLSHESLGRRALWRADPYTAWRTRVELGSQRAHGWNAYDSEHWTTDLLFDYWSVSNDAWAKAELAHMGECLKGLFRLRDYNTRWIQAVRAEGWAMQSFVQVWLATQDPAIKEYALRRIREVVEPQRSKDHPAKMLTYQGTYAGTRFPGSHEFYMPWQHGPVLYGYLAAYEFFEESLALRICEDVATCVEYAWVSNYTDPVTRVVVPQGLRYYCPISYEGNPVPANIWDQNPDIRVRWGDSPLGGAHIFLIGGLHRLALETSDQAVRQKALRYGALLFPGLDEDARWSRWRFTVPQHWMPSGQQ